jgi:subtilisin family serine protease
LLAEARALPGVRFAEPDYWVRVCRFPNDTYFATQQWDKWVMYADLAWDLSTGSNSIKVAVVDNGCDYEHPDLAANFNTQELGYDFVGQDLTPRPDNYAIPDAFHGTHVAGIIGAVIDNSRGVAGWAQCRLVAVRVLNDSGSGMTSDLASGIRWAVDHGCKVLNMSLSGSSAPSELVEACDYAEEHGVLLVAASGNDGAGTIGYPAALGSCIAVGSTAENSRLADYSNHGPQQELVAPGTNVFSCAPGGNYVTASGTSMASPQVSGVAALVWSANTGLSAVRIRSLLDAAAIDMGATGRDNWYGHGLLNGRRGLELALADGVRAMSGHSEPVRVRVGSGSVLLPEWCTQARAFDITGREVARGSGRLQLRPGVYALRMQGAAGEQCEKVLVAN